jgi:hypothetical protein
MPPRIPKGGQAMDQRGDLAGELLERWRSGLESN